MEQKKDTKSTVVIALLLIIIAILIGACYFAYSRYTSSTSGNGTATVAKWNFGTTTTLTNLNLATTSGATVFDTVNNVATNRIAPGTTGHFSVALGTTGTEVAVQYDIILSNMQNKPQNLHFYSDSACANEIDATGGAHLTGFIAKGDTGADHTVTIYWKWPYQTGSTDAEKATNDAKDTADGEAAETVTFDLTVKGTQVNPADPEVTTSAEAVVAP